MEELVFSCNPTAAFLDNPRTTTLDSSTRIHPTEAKHVDHRQCLVSRSMTVKGDEYLISRTAPVGSQVDLLAPVEFQTEKNKTRTDSRKKMTKKRRWCQLVLRSHLRFDLVKECLASYQACFRFLRTLVQLWYRPGPSRTESMEILNFQIPFSLVDLSYLLIPSIDAEVQPKRWLMLSNRFSMSC